MGCYTDKPAKAPITKLGCGNQLDSHSRILGAFACSGFSQPRCILVAKLLKSVTENRDPKQHLSLSVAICDRKYALAVV